MPVEDDPAPEPARARLAQDEQPAPVALGPPAAIVLAAFSGRRSADLGALLGEGEATALEATLALRARRWAAAVAPEVAFEATSPETAAIALGDHAGPVLLVAADVPGLHLRHAAQALDDLAAGARAVLAPANDGLPFLVALPGPDWALLDALQGGFDALVTAVGDHPGGLGMLSSERRLTSAADARALAADPQAPEELVAHLRAALPVRRPAP